MIESVCRIVTVLALVSGGWFALWKYEDAVEKSFRKPFWEKQIQCYFEASKYASILATSCDEEERSNAKGKFYQLYYGMLAMVEDDKVEEAMIEFHKELSSSKNILCGTKKLKNLSLELAWNLRSSIGSTWDIQLPTVKGKENSVN